MQLFAQFKKILRRGFRATSNFRKFEQNRKKNLKKKLIQMRTLVRICPHFHTFLCKFFSFLNACISVKTSLINTKLGDFVNLGVLFLTMWINSC